MSEKYNSSGASANKLNISNVELYVEATFAILKVSQLDVFKTTMSGQITIEKNAKSCVVLEATSNWKLFLREHMVKLKIISYIYRKT